jgi:superfamily II DNA or RNA helicase
MELKLNTHIKENYINCNIDFPNSEIQKLIESYNTSIGLDKNVMESVKYYVNIYNSYLSTKNIKEKELRYYQILAIYYTEVYFNNIDILGLTFSDNALAYWMATGSGKTILMHINIIQYIEKYSFIDDLEIIITTPGVDLVTQHKKELEEFIQFLNDKYINCNIRLIVETTSKLLNKSEDYFDIPPNQNNSKRLVIIDEAHIGIGSSNSKSFYALRGELNKVNSFLLEYSATYYNVDEDKKDQYEKSIIYTYSYESFYRDGYGKDYHIKEITADITESFVGNIQSNLACIQNKLELYDSKVNDIVTKYQAKSKPDKPLIAFMGRTVHEEVSDVIEVVTYFSKLNSNKREQYINIFNNKITGNLKLTKNPQSNDILLSYGEGDYWGIINVSNSNEFIKNHLITSNDNIDLTDGRKLILDDKYLFENIDSPNSPINVLIGSKKFAEGWNCFRVSVIGLLNIGITKGNKIIQMFGRGVRLKGLNDDGKRKNIIQEKSYDNLDDGNLQDVLLKLETLCIISLNKTYLTNFLNGLNNEIVFSKKLVYPVTFDEKNELPIFKLSKDKYEVKEITLLDSNNVSYSYLENDTVTSSDISNIKFSLDFRTDKDKVGEDIKDDLEKVNVCYYEFLNHLSYIEALNTHSKNLHIKVKKDGYKYVKINDIMPYISEIKYNSRIDKTNFKLISNINNHIAREFLNKLNNKVNWHLNSSKYSYGYVEQSTDVTRGQIVKEYEVTFFSNKDEKKSEFDERISKVDLDNEINQIKINNITKHIYYPLLSSSNNSSLPSTAKWHPKKLNKGEEKFINDITTFFLTDETKLGEQYICYFMRNDESLKSIGLYLEDDTSVYYPDFVMWIVSNQKVWINLIDPKGQMGIIDHTSGNYHENSKVKISNKSDDDTLSKIEKGLKEKFKKEFVLNSFILLRDSSKLGNGKNDDWIKENMINKHILRLNWHPEDEEGNRINKEFQGKTYIDWMLYLSGIISRDKEVY